MGLGDNKRIAINSVIIFIRLCIVSLVGIISSRLVLDALGASDFGLYNVVGGIVTLLNVFNTAMLSTTYRFIAFEIGKKEDGNPNKVFNTSITIHAAFAIILFVVGVIVGDWYIKNYLDFGNNSIDNALFIFHISLCTTAISTLFVPFHGLLVAFERFKTNAIIDIISSLLKICLIIAFIYSDGNRIRIYSLILLSSIAFSCLSYYIYCRIKFKSITSFCFPKDTTLYKDMLSYAWWTLFGAIAIIGKDQGSKILINYFFGTIVNAAYAIASQLDSFILTFARSLSSAAVPQITKNFSGGNSNRSIKLTSYISKYTFILMSLVAFPTLLEMDFLLTIWLKEVPEGATLFCKLIIVNSLLSCLGEGIPALVNATGNIKTYQIIYQTINFLGLPIAYICFLIGYNQYSILIVYCVVTFICAFVRIILLKRIFGFDVSLIIKTSYVKIFILVIPLVIYYIIYNPSSFSTIAHILGIIGSEFFLLCMILLLGLDKDEKGLIKRFVSTLRSS